MVPTLSLGPSNSLIVEKFGGELVVIVGNSQKDKAAIEGIQKVTATLGALQHHHYQHSTTTTSILPPLPAFYRHYQQHSMGYMSIIPHKARIYTSFCY